MPRYLDATMTLGNMRANGVRTLGAWCSGRNCHHHGVVDVERYSDDTPVRRFGPRLRCERCGHLGADARPNWSERQVSGRVGYNGFLRGRNCDPTFGCGGP